MADQLWFSITIRKTVVIAWLALGVGALGAVGGTDAVMCVGTGATLPMALGDTDTGEAALTALIVGVRDAAACVAVELGDGCIVHASKRTSGTSTTASVRQHIIESPSHRLQCSFSIACSGGNCLSVEQIHEASMKKRLERRLSERAVDQGLLLRLPAFSGFI